MIIARSPSARRGDREPDPAEAVAGVLPRAEAPANRDSRPAAEGGLHGAVGTSDQADVDEPGPPQPSARSGRRSPGTRCSRKRPVEVAAPSPSLSKRCRVKPIRVDHGSAQPTDLADRQHGPRRQVDHGRASPHRPSAIRMASCSTRRRGRTTSIRDPREPARGPARARWTRPSSSSWSPFGR